jgi:hypothetical protein
MKKYRLLIIAALAALATLVAVQNPAFIDWAHYNAWLVQWGGGVAC